jgi:hypothetical protein
VVESELSSFCLNLKRLFGLFIHVSEHFDYDDLVFEGIMSNVGDSEGSIFAKDLHESVVVESLLVGFGLVLHSNFKLFIINIFKH